MHFSKDDTVVVSPFCGGDGPYTQDADLVDCPDCWDLVNQPGGHDPFKIWRLAFRLLEQPSQKDIKTAAYLLVRLAKKLDGSEPKDMRDWLRSPIDPDALKPFPEKLD